MTPGSASKKKRDFNPKKFLTTIGEGRKVVTFPKNGTIYAQGADCDAVFDYNGDGLEVHSSLLNVVLHDSPV
jgi:hypothetical protein